MTDVDFNYKINLLFNENSIYVSYFNSKIMGYEIWVTEAYEKII